jgi:hypothetical protein
VQQLRELGDVGNACMRRGQTVDPPLRVRPDMQLHPEMPRVPVRVCFISGSRAWAAFFVELGAAMIVAPTASELLHRPQD